MKFGAGKIIINPIVTEKSAMLGTDNKFVFRVKTDTNRIEVTKAIEELYGVNVIRVNMARIKGKAVNFGKFSGKQKNWKKALVTLKEGDKIEPLV